MKVLRPLKPTNSTEVDNTYCILPKEANKSDFSKPMHPRSKKLNRFVKTEVDGYVDAYMVITPSGKAIPFVGD